MYVGVAAGINLDLRIIHISFLRSGKHSLPFITVHSKDAIHHEKTLCIVTESSVQFVVTVR
jgi:hypothetical protein